MVKQSDILDGHLEQKIRKALAELAELSPPGVKSWNVSLCISSSDSACYLAMAYENSDINAYGCDSFEEALNTIREKLSDKARAEARRKKIEEQIAALQTELAAIKLS